MKYNNVLYITDNYLYLKNKKSDVIKYEVGKGIIYGGKIINARKFIKLYDKLLSDKHLNNSLFGDTIKVIVLANYSEVDINNLKSILNTFNYRKIMVVSEVKYYKLNNKSCYVNVNDNYLSINYIDKFNRVDNIFMESRNFKNNSDLMAYLDYVVEKREVYLLGDGELIKDIFNLFEEKYNKKTYIFNGAQTYIITRKN